MTKEMTSNNLSSLSVHFSLFLLKDVVTGQVTSRLPQLHLSVDRSTMHIYILSDMLRAPNPKLVVGGVDFMLNCVATYFITTIPSWHCSAVRCRHLNWRLKIMAVPSTTTLSPLGQSIDPDFTFGTAVVVQLQ